LNFAKSLLLGLGKAAGNLYLIFDWLTQQFEIISHTWLADTTIRNYTVRFCRSFPYDPALDLNADLLRRATPAWSFLYQWCNPASRRGKLYFYDFSSSMNVQHTLYQLIYVTVQILQLYFAWVEWMWILFQGPDSDFIGV